MGGRGSAHEGSRQGEHGAMGSASSNNGPRSSENSSSARGTDCATHTKSADPSHNSIARAAAESYSKSSFMSGAFHSFSETTEHHTQTKDTSSKNATYSVHAKSEQITHGLGHHHQARGQVPCHEQSQKAYNRRHEQVATSEPVLKTQPVTQPFEPVQVVPPVQPVIQPVNSELPVNPVQNPIQSVIPSLQPELPPRSHGGCDEKLIQRPDERLCRLEPPSRL